MGNLQFCDDLSHGSEVEEIVAEAISSSKSNGRDKGFIQVELVASFSENGEMNHVAPSPL